jgi:hypothetical protein
VEFAMNMTKEPEPRNLMGALLIRAGAGDLPLLAGAADP